MQSFTHLLPIYSGFQKCPNFISWGVAEGRAASPCQISSKSFNPLQRYSDFSFLKMAAVRHVRFVWGTFGPPTKGTWRSLSLWKFGCNRCSSFGNMKVWIFRTFGLKTPIHTSKIGVLGEFDPLNGQQYQRNSKKAHPCASLRRVSHQALKSADQSDL